MKLQAKQRLTAALGPDKDYTNVGNRLLRAIRRLDPQIKPPKMQHTNEGYTYAFQPAKKLPIAVIAKAVIALDTEAGSFSQADQSVVFYFDTPYGVQYQEVFRINAYEDEPDSKLFQIVLKDR
jgi:hypothetical protein